METPAGCSRSGCCRLLLLAAGLGVLVLGERLGVTGTAGAALVLLGHFVLVARQR